MDKELQDVDFAPMVEAMRDAHHVQSVGGWSRIPDSQAFSMVRAVILEWEHRKQKQTLVTDSLGFQLRVEICITDDLSERGRHKTFEDEHGKAYKDAPHRIRIRSGLLSGELSEVISHEVYHLFYSVRHLITADEETEAETFGHLVKRIHAIYHDLSWGV